MQNICELSYFSEVYMRLVKCSAV